MKVKAPMMNIGSVPNSTAVKTTARFSASIEKPMQGTAKGNPCGAKMDSMTMGRSGGCC